MRNRTVRQIRSAPSTHHDPVVRGANAIDRYSLALQLIQVYPIVLAGVAVVFPLEWLRILIAVLGLMVWTVLAVVRERSTESGGRNDAVPLPASAEKARIATATVETAQGIRVDIWLHPYSGCGHKPVGRRLGHRLVLPRVHRALPREAPPTSSEFCQRSGA
ncbi:hypothetical protein [Catenulispora rubra]|uniref:hypothetical protein n=1 Tax=Catenulispora rubra TaxID=280293 RepID=UPI0018925418|nr:hypothetical protein [Catenulispora rubra]